LFSGADPRANVMAGVSSLTFSWSTFLIAILFVSTQFFQTLVLQKNR
jgi:hypothetical protein